MPDTGMANLTGLPCLEELFLQDVKASDAGLAHLALITGLKTLNLKGTEISHTMRAYLAKSVENWDTIRYP